MAGRRTASRRRVAGAIAGFVAAGAAVVATPAAAAPVAVEGGSITWGVRDEFRSYLASPASEGGTMTTDGGATQAPGNGPFTFPVTGGSRDAAAGTVDVTSTGSVHFLAHGGILDMLLSDVRIDIDGATAYLVADMVSRAFIDTTTAGPLLTYDDVQLVELDLSGVTPAVAGSTVTYSNVPTTLTTAGAPAFGGFYAAGTAFAPVSFTVELTDPAPDPDPAPAPTGSLVWRISQQAWTSGSLTPGHTAVAPATKDPDAGFVFPVRSVAYDPATGATDLRFDGAALIGSSPAQGDYRVGFADLHVIVDGTGAGRLEADPSYCIGATADPPCTPITGEDITIFTFQVDVDDVQDHGGTVEATYTADPWPFVGPFPNDVDSFHPDFISFLPASLQAHFRATGATGSNLNKPPAPLAVTFGYPVPDGVAITTTVAPGGLTISIADDTVVLPTPTLDPSGTALVTTGSLGAVTVTDTRATDPGWNVTAQLTDFAGPAGSFSGAGLGWTPSVTSTTPGQSVTAGAPVAPGAGLSGAELAEAAPGGGVGTAVLDAELDLELPTGTPPGTYTATLTLTAI